MSAGWRSLSLLATLAAGTQAWSPQLRAPRTRRLANLVPHACNLGGDTGRISRRSLFVGLVALEGGHTAFGRSTPSADAADDLASAAIDARRDLLVAISAGLPDDQVLAKIAVLESFDPSHRREATLESLDGTWRLLWSFKAEAFSPLLRLPVPLRPDSLQLLGEPATAEVGPGRVAQVLTNGVLGPGKVYLSSGVAPSTTGDRRTLEIFPPFRLQAALRGSKSKLTLVEAGSDAEFRSINARSAEAQAAPRNMYLQSYLEVSGVGDLRISRIISGDPVIVGAVFVHQREAEERVGT